MGMETETEIMGIMVIIHIQIHTQTPFLEAMLFLMLFLMDHRFLLHWLLPLAHSVDKEEQELYTGLLLMVVSYVLVNL